MAMQTGPVYVPYPFPVVRRPGLFDAATGPLDLPTHARTGGIQYQTALCTGLPECYTIDCQSSGDRDTKSFSGDADEGGDIFTMLGEPFVVYSTVSCSPVGMTDADLRQYLFNRLVAGEQSTVERMFSQGDTDPESCGLVPGLPLDAGTTEVTTVAVDPVAALGLLESAVAADYGLPVTIHVPAILASYFMNLHLLEGGLRGNVWYSAMGNKIVFGNYLGLVPDGSAPAVGETWIYATAQVGIWRTPDSEIFATNRMQTLNRTTNLVTAVMEREYVVDYDTCVNYAAQVDITGVVV